MSEIIHVPTNRKVPVLQTGGRWRKSDGDPPSGSGSQEFRPGARGTGGFATPLNLARTRITVGADRGLPMASPPCGR
jgi:hypothetical protein